MTPRSSKPSTSETVPPPQQGVPIIPAGAQDHSFYLQSVISIERAIGGLDATVKGLQASAEKHSTKIDSLAAEAATAKGMVKAFGWVLSGLGAIGLALLSAILTLIIKHYK